LLVFEIMRAAGADVVADKKKGVVSTAVVVVKQLIKIRIIRVLLDTIVTVVAVPVSLGC
jgi:hypothetical protein